MTVVRCVSSQLTTELMNWRNSGWESKFSKAPINNACKFLGKVISTEIGLAILATASAIETVVYGVLTFASLAMRPITNKPYEFIVEHLASSSFTVLWTVANVGFNLFTLKLLPNHESAARLWSDMYFPKNDKLYRSQDRAYVASLGHAPIQSKI